ncbi:type VI secretion system lipoprotein TssJ [Pseudomonas mosselii]|uniref:type VI secretion system lipoprotein TssJ n=1 Tax=Pseudomonas TaxID=286 RepID=UPI000B58DD7D|nr:MULTISPECIES: type VI secretion system lipoprotein TssJ [Pseudomonas]MBC7209384.1 type VI secretion system lipoprotein TssJ [Pseudomonas sp.]MBH3310570.1 type VI secretion system lipoprotein TssJ [Pseudomonas mosselii]MBH3323234.1 type VI secretion system lipoprotein TssJ [Pseudomonas mosselii]MDH1509580.1 type VI secretion system lipoprotein TssJ [Pseudomonas mosselii]OWQ36314.1 type VI secretion system-associated lipoprotein [Pseudomonas sp. DrBHI1]
MSATRLIAALAMVLLSACSKDSPVEPAVTDAAPPATGITLYFSAAAGLNPGASGTPAPVRVRIYELKNSAAFARADYFALAERAQATLAADLIDQDEVLLQPGEQLRLERPLDPATRQVGLVVGYREVDQAQWRSVLPVPPRDYQISLDVRAVRSAVATPQPEPVR